MTGASTLAVDDVDIPEGLGAFRDASPELLAARALQQRVDRKFLLPKEALDSLLDGLCADFRVVRAEGRLAATYDSRYFDTPDRQMYEDHRRGRGRRHKVRVRHHLERRLTFLEVKGKHANGRTSKARLARPFGEAELDAEGLAFIEQHSPFRAGVLVPVISTAFRRITLVGEQADERITIDWDLELRDDHQRERLTRVAIAEIKQAGYSNSTDAVRVCRALHIRETAVSKYCLATARLAAAVRRTTFRPILRAVEQLSA
jgi:hypothetical protein